MSDDWNAGLDRLNAMLAWWGVSKTNGEDGVEARLKRFQAFTSDLQEVFSNAQSEQMRSLFATNEAVANSLKDLGHCRQPRDVLAAEMVVLATLLDGTSRRTKIWVELLQKVQNCCSSLVRDAAEDLSSPERSDAASKSPASTERRRGKDEDARTS